MNTKTIDVDDLLFCEGGRLSSTANGFVVKLFDPRTGILYKKRVINKGNGIDAESQFGSIYKTYKVLSKIKNCAIPKIYCITNDSDSIVLLEEWIEGETLQSMIDRGVVFSVDDIYSILKQLCDIFDVLQDFKIIHRDVKPANIVWSEKKVYLIDFDIAREASNSGKQDTRIGYTQGYAAPEQFGYQSTDVRSDIYSLGATVLSLFETSGLHDKHLEQIAKECMAFNPDDRIQNIGELQKSINGRKVYSGKQAKISRNRRKWGLAVAGLSLICMLCGVWIYLNSSVSPNDVKLSWAVSETSSAYDALSTSSPIELICESAKTEDPLGLSSFVNVCNMRYVTYCFPQSSIRFNIQNDSGVALKNPILTFTFTDMMIPSGNLNDIEKTEPIGFYQGISAWSGFIWSPSDVINPQGNQSVEIPLWDSSIGMNACVTISLTASNYEGYSVTIPIDGFSERRELFEGIKLDASQAVEKTDLTDGEEIMVYGKVIDMNESGIGNVAGGMSLNDAKLNTQLEVHMVDSGYYNENDITALQIAGIKGTVAHNNQGDVFLDNAVLINAYQAPNHELPDENERVDLSCFLGCTISQFEYYTGIQLKQLDTGYYTTENNVLCLGVKENNPIEIDQIVFLADIDGFSLGGITVGDSLTQAKELTKNRPMYLCDEFQCNAYYNGAFGIGYEVADQEMADQLNIATDEVVLVFCENRWEYMRTSL